MNRLRACISSIQTHEKVSRVCLNYQNQKLNAITLELPSFVRQNAEVFVCFKETEVGVAKGSCEHISFSNLFEGKIESIQKGVILSSIKVMHHSHQLTSIITTAALERLHLSIGDSVILFVKATELSLEEIG